MDEESRSKCFTPQSHALASSFKMLSLSIRAADHTTRQEASFMKLEGISSNMGLKSPL